MMNCCKLEESGEEETMYTEISLPYCPPKSAMKSWCPSPSGSSSAYTSLRHRRFQPLVPRGVVFESPERGSKKPCEEAWEAECLEQDASEEEMDTESGEKDSDCILVDLSKDLTPSKNTRGTGDLWSLNIVQTVSEDMVMAESVPLSQLSHSNFAPVEIRTNTKACLKSVRKTRGPFETNAKIINDTVSSENDSSQRSRHGSVHNNHTLSMRDSVSQHSGHGIDQDSGHGIDQDSGHGIDQDSGHGIDQHSGHGIDQHSGHGHNVK
ncbi:uncharacterized protein [Cebidichthys violaceus]|uniref:uncharacterized protein n=1 Tax=Cebidichthys violaceus TaxID=271503 RepID=UPI0035CA8111